MAGGVDDGATFQGPGGNGGGDGGADFNGNGCDLKVYVPCIDGVKKYGSFRIRIINFPKPNFEKSCIEKWYDVYREKFEDCEEL